MGREKTSDGVTKEEVVEDRAAGGEDLKESFEIGREGVEGLPNHWPDEISKEGGEFKMTMMEFFGATSFPHSFSIVLRQGFWIMSVKFPPPLPLSREQDTVPEEEC